MEPFSFATFLLFLSSCATKETVFWFRMGEEVTLNCSNLESDEILWFKAENVSLPPLASRPVYTVLPLQESLSYSCTNSSLHLYQLFRLKEASPPEVSESYLSSNMQLPISHCDLDIPSSICCSSRIVNASPPPKITWYYRQKRIGQHQNDSKPLPGGSLVVHRPGSHLNDSFLCVAENYAGNLNITFSFEVIPIGFDRNCSSSPCPRVPSFEGIDRSHESVEEGDNVSIHLKAAGYLNWMYVVMRKNHTKDQCCVSPDMFNNLANCSHTFEGQTTGDCHLSCTFVIQNVNTSDAGNYTFFAVNAIVPQQLTEFHLTVSSPSAKTWIYIAAGSASGGVLVMATAAALLFIFLRKKLELEEQKPRSMNRADYDYDFFIAYSENDSEWVKTHLVDLIEGNHAHDGVTLCIHHSHFTPGVDVLDNIKHMLGRCWKVLAVISRSSVGSQWCKVELGKAVVLGKYVMTLLVIEDVGDLPRLISKVDERFNVYGEIGGEGTLTVDEKVRNALDKILSKAENSKHDVFIGFPNGADEGHKQAVKDTADSLNLSYMSLPSLNCPSERLDHALRRCLRLTKTAVCLLSGDSAMDFWSRLKKAIEGFERTHEQYNLVLVVCPDINIDVGALDCVKILVGDGSNDWKKQLKNHLCDACGSSNA